MTLVFLFFILDKHRLFSFLFMSFNLSNWLSFFPLIWLKRQRRSYLINEYFYFHIDSVARSEFKQKREIVFDRNEIFFQGQMFDILYKVSVFLSTEHSAELKQKKSVTWWKSLFITDYLFFVYIGSNKRLSIYTQVDHSDRRNGALYGLKRL